MAGVLIQMSWFVVGALVDVSTIATSAIAAFPAKFASTSNLENQMKSEIGKIQQVYVAKFEDGKINRETPQPISDE
ncbi:hypothetical protein KKG31_04225 [Patescibacteria group bacterium]|nr:hypothetical protein [Patescibacteria group bacterium]